MRPATPTKSAWIELSDVPRKARDKIAAAFGSEKLRYDPDTLTLALPSRMRDVSWEQYSALLKALPDHRLRHSYDRGTLEMMSPSDRHDKLKTVIGRLIEHMTISMGIRIECFGSATRRRRSVKRGLEPDETYFIANEPAMRGRFDYRPEHDPPPDLVLEVDLRRPSSRRMKIYASLGVPEVWKYRKGEVEFLALGPDSKYSPVEQSLSFPFLTPADITRHLDRLPSEPTDDVIVDFAKWAKKQKKKYEAAHPKKRKKS